MNALSPIDLPFITLMAAGASSFALWMRAFDALLRRIYTTDRDRWVSLGAPPGWFWSPPETSWWCAARRQKLIMDTWLYKPIWLASDPVLRRLWRRMFIWSMIGILVPVLMMIYMALSPPNV